jgi:ABC-type transporter Mla maintaining outer membrane lipid asymmetry ATPase subunit MlaF
MTVPLEFEGVALGRLRRRTLAPFESGEQTGDPGFFLTVPSGQVVVALGDESSGVDCLGVVVLGLTPAPIGACRVFGVELARLARAELLAYRRRIGYLPVGDGLLHNLSLRDNVRLPLRFGSDLQVAEIEGRTDRILDRLRLTRFSGLRPADANEEERRRAALARALAFDPDLLVLEEPFAGLTDLVSEELLEAARGDEGPRRGHRTVFITGQSLPAPLRREVDREVRVVRGQAVEELE